MEAVSSSETLISYRITTQSRNPEDLDLSLQRRENLKSRNDESWWQHDSEALEPCNFYA
jgi:hypothetical protein